jgi:hypothetical protein
MCIISKLTKVSYENPKNNIQADKKTEPVPENVAEKKIPGSDTLKSEVQIKNFPKVPETSVPGTIGLIEHSSDIEPYRDQLGLAQYPLTSPEILDSVAGSAIKNLAEDGQKILEAVILNPNSSDRTLNKISSFLLKQPKVDQDLLLTLASHDNISKDTLNNLANSVKGKKNLDLLYEFCEAKLKSK